jgi:hypothetical protein
VGCHLPDTADLPVPAMFVEFAHIYADSVFGSEQDDSLTVVKDYLDRESTADSLVVTAILIDELHVEHDTLDVNEFIRCILRRGLAPDHVVFEGKLGSVAQLIVSRLETLVGDSLSWLTFRKQGKKVLTFTDVSGQQIGLLTRFDDGREEWSCAILSAAWSVCRAGLEEFPADAIVKLTEAPVYGDRIVSVLHSKYQGVEEKVIKLITAAGYDEVLPRIDLVYFS